MIASARAFLLLAIVLLVGCETTDSGAPQRAAMNAAIRQEAPGNYFIGRRFYKKDYKMWGWVRKPGQLWDTAKLVMLNEQKTLAPDRASGTLGNDNNVEYRLNGHFSGEMVYEPASNKFYPEFVLSSYEVINRTPPMIFRDSRSIDPSVRLLAPPL